MLEGMIASSLPSCQLHAHSHQVSLCLPCTSLPAVPPKAFVWLYHATPCREASRTTYTCAPSLPSAQCGWCPTKLLSLPFS